MARVLNNSLVEGVSGQVGKQVCFRTRGDKTFIAAKPVSRKGKIPPPTQQKTNNRFKNAVAYGQFVKADPELSALYAIAVAKKKTEYTSVYHAGMRDALTDPEHLPMINRNFTGKPGDTLGIYSKDIVPLANLRFSIQDADGLELEAGMVASGTITGEFIYTCHTKLENLASLQVVITAIDMPGRTFPEDFPFPQQSFPIKAFTS
jgi:hypothetical protein